MPDVRLDQAARLATEWNNLGSREFRVTQENTRLPMLLGINTKICRWAVTHYVETPARQRFLDEVLIDKANTSLLHKTSRTDGHRFSITEYRKDAPDFPDQLFIGTSFNNEATAGGSARPDPLKYYFIDKLPLHEALPSSTYLGSQQIEGRLSHAFLFKDVQWAQMRQQVVVHLAEDALFPHQVLFYLSEDDRAQDRLSWKWSATAQESHQGKLIPVKSRTVQYDHDHPGRETSEVLMTVDEVAFGKTYPASMFWQEADARTTVFDGVQGKIIPAAIPPVATKATVSNPIRVEEATASASYLAGGCLALGVVVLIAGVVLWLRRA